MKEIVVIETIEDIDKNKDGKVTEDEYIGEGDCFFNHLKVFHNPFLCKLHC